LEKILRNKEENRIYDAPYAKCNLDTLFVDKIFYILMKKSGDERG
jgi:hypothetical protein